MTLVIGLTGEKGSGKQTFTDLLTEIAEGKTIKQVRFSDILADTLKLWDIPQTRSNLQKLAITMDQGFGLGTLTHAMYYRVSQENADIVVIDGIRWHTDVEMLRKLPRNILIYITADIETRYQRLKTRSEKIAEQGLSFEQFMKEEKAKTELEISQLGTTADITIQNNSSVTTLKQLISDISKQLLPT